MYDTLDNSHENFQELQARLDMFIDTNQAAVDFSKLALLALLLSNGLAALVILVVGLLSPVPVIISAPFGWGAVWAIVALTATYFYCLLLLETWRVPPPASPDDLYYSTGFLFWQWRFSVRQVERARLFPLIPAVISFVHLVQGVIAISQ
jgi:hypothetical protein